VSNVHVHTLRLTIAAGILGAAWSVAGRIEGHFFPVVTDIEITSIEPMAGGWSRVWGTFEKPRDCGFRGLDVILGGETWVDWRSMEGAKIRKPGGEDGTGAAAPESNPNLEHFGPWQVQVDGRQLETKTRMIARNRCHPFWLTVTEFYPGAKTRKDTGQ
jgi:hypothetical protein